MKNGMSEMSGLADRSTGWNRWSQGKIFALLATGLLAMPATAFSSIVLDFEGVGDLNPVADFYDGGGPLEVNYGITFSSDAYSLESNPIFNGTGKFENSPGEPDSYTAMFLLSGGDTGDPVTATLEFADGVTDLSFYYTATVGGFVNAFDEFGGSVGTISFAANSDPSTCTAALPFCVFTRLSMSLTGIATSLVFGGGNALIGFDNIELTPAAAPVPLPAAAWLLLSGLAGLGFVGRRRASK